MKPLAETITPLKTRPTLELDELWSFVHDKEHQVWIWVAFERETSRIVGLAFGDRSSETCEELDCQDIVDTKQGKRTKIAALYAH